MPPGFSQRSLLRFLHPGQIPTGRLRCPTKCDAQLSESNFQTRSRSDRENSPAGDGQGCFLRDFCGKMRKMGEILESFYKRREISML
ncbi:MAG: DUF6783 domain-containing protein [Enterocloster sp.]